MKKISLEPKSPEPDEFGPEERQPGERWGQWQTRLQKRAKAEAKKRGVELETASAAVVEAMLSSVIDQVNNAQTAYNENLEWRGMTRPDHLKAMLGVFKLEFLEAHRLMQGQNRATFNKKHRVCRDFLEKVAISLEDLDIAELSGENTDTQTIRTSQIMVHALGGLHKCLREQTTPEGRQRAVTLFEERWLQ